MKTLPTTFTIAGILLLSACGSNGSDSMIPTTSSTAPTTNPAAINGYRAFWDDYLAVTNPMTPGNPRIAAHTTGDELAALNGIVVAGHAKGSIYKGSFDLNPAVESTTSDAANIKDCYIDRTGEFNATTGERIDKEDLTPRNITATMKLVDGVWKVASIDNKSAPCSP